MSPTLLRVGLLAMLAPPLVAQARPAPPDTTRTPAKLEEITVTAGVARRSDPLGSLSLSRTVLRAVPALNAYDRLRLSAGLEVHDQGQGPGFASDASLRGFSSDHSTDIALWIDCVPVNEPVNGHAEGYNDWSLLFPQAIRSIEVFKGPTSALYGNFALAGVVNVRTLERIRGSEAELSGGAYGRVEGSLLTGWDRSTSAGVFGLRGQRETGWRPNSGYELGQGHARLTRDLGARTSLDAGVELYGAGWDSPGFLTLEQFAAKDYQRVSNPTDGGYKHRAQERVSLRVIGGASLLWRSTVYATQGRWQLFLTTPPEGGITEGSGSQVEEEDRRYGLGATTALTWTGTRNTLTLGAETRWDHSNYENWFVTNRTRDSAETLVDASQAAGALFVQSSAQLGPYLRVSLGGRADLVHARSVPAGETAASDSRAIFAPKAGVLLHLPKLFELYANVSRGFRQTDGVIRDPTLPFITAWSYEGGLKLDRRGVSGSVAAFLMDVSNEQTFDPLSATSTSGGRSRRKGVELVLDTQPVPEARIRGEWTFLDARYRRLVTQDGDTLTGTRVFNTAKYVGALSLSLGPAAGRWEVTPAVNVVGPYSPFDAPGVTESAYALVHLTGAVNLGRARLSVGVRNVLNRSYPELRAGEFVVPGQPRTVSASLGYSFGPRS